MYKDGHVRLRGDGNLLRAQAGLTHHQPSFSMPPSMPLVFWGALWWSWLLLPWAVGMPARSPFNSKLYFSAPVSNCASACCLSCPLNLVPTPSTPGFGREGGSREELLPEAPPNTERTRNWQPLWPQWWFSEMNFIVSLQYSCSVLDYEAIKTVTMILWPEGAYTLGWETDIPMKHGEMWSQTVTQ